MEVSKEYDTRIVNKYRGVLRTCHAALSKEDIRDIRKTFNLCYESTQLADPFLGESFILYPLSVGRIISSELGLGSQSIISAFLYPCVKHGYLTMEDVRKHFSHPIPDVVESLVRISSYDKHNNIAQADHFRKLIVSVSRDLRVILIKLSERLWIMRHLHRFTKRAQDAIASEVAHVYAPLAHRFGLYKLKTELDDLSLQFQEPERYQYIERKLKETTAKRNRFIRKFTEPIRIDLDRLGFDYEIKGRTKSVYSIWNKMKKQEVEFDEVYDIFAIRIILNTSLRDEKTDCWAVYSLVTNHYQPNPGRMRDWISIPKSNGYESLHTTVLVPGGKWVEVQIRTSRMDEIAEKGLAAHWKYKGGAEDLKFEKWIASIRDIIEETKEDSLSIVENVDLQAYEEEVFVFTPKGELKKYPQGAVVLDFAFDIHSDIGACCTGARVNNMNVPIRYELKNGDEVEIITARTQKPKTEWLDIVKTSRAKAKIKQIIRKEKFSEAEVGKEIFSRRCKNWKLDITDTLMNGLLKKFTFSHAVDFYLAIANGRLDLSEVKKYMITLSEESKEHPAEFHEPQKLVKVKTPKENEYILVDELTGRVDYKLAQCCNPVMGDVILGFVSVSEGIKIHRKNCLNVQHLKSQYPYRILQAKWTGTQCDVKYPTTLEVNGYDDMGLVNRISSLISQEFKIEMQSIAFESKNGLFYGKITILVSDTNYLDKLILHIRKLKGIIRIVRHEEQ